jgi:hypothetical protein
MLRDIIELKNILQRMINIYINVAMIGNVNQENYPKELYESN